MHHNDMVQARLMGAVSAIESLREQTDAIGSACRFIVERLGAGACIYTAGNGGSAAEAMHLSEELIGRYRSSRAPLPAVCLNADPTALTCIANDFGFEQVFARQLRALAKSGDVLIVFSTSGKSANLVEVIKTARECGVHTFALLGRDGGTCAELADRAVIVPRDDSGHIQEAHQVLLHILCEAVEAAFAAS
ncbi:MAG: D-sedoheptulose-7-phosphate isomerase [Phycisphaerales bacterium]